MNLQDLLDVSAKEAQTKGFNPTFPEFIALAHSELSEALEEYRKGYPPHVVYYTTPQETLDKLKADLGRELTHDDIGTDHLKPEGIPVELADVIIRIAHYCGHHKIDLIKAIQDKLAFNRTRPFMHGKKL